MADITLIKNGDIDHRVDNYYRRYKQFGHISFEMTINEYKELTKITKSYKAAKQCSDFEHENWVNRASKEGLFSDDKATFVFGFLSLEWTKQTHISVNKSDEFVLVEVTHREIKGVTW